MTAATFSALQVEEVAGIISRATRHAAIDIAELGREIEDLLSAVGTANDGSKDAHLFANPPIPDASHLDLVKQFRAIAASDDPLDPAICHGVALAELEAAAAQQMDQPALQSPDQSPLHGIGRHLRFSHREGACRH